jgi:hypothetical protein
MTAHPLLWLVMLMALRLAPSLFAAVALLAGVALAKEPPTATFDR